MYRRRRKHVQEHDANLDRWLVSYADYMTLMFALFVVLYATAMIKEEHYELLSQTLGQVFEQKGASGSGVKGEGLLLHNEPIDSEHELYGSSIVEERGPELLDGRIEVSNITNKNIGHPLEGLAQELDNALLELVENGIAELERDDDWLLISLNSNVMFASGSASPSSSAKVVLKEVVDIVGPVNNFIRVRGYTDNQRISNEVFSSNWELSVARATAALKILESMGVAGQRMAIEGYGQYAPFADNDTEQGRNENRKVVIALSKYAYQPKPEQAKPKTEATETVTPEEKGDFDQVQVIKLPSGGIRITTRRDNSDAAKTQNSNKTDKKDDKGSN